MAKRNTPSGLVKCGFQTISLANSTALGLNTTCIVGKVFHLSVETNDIRYRADGTNPALTTGVLLTSGFAYWLFDIPGSTLKFQRKTGTAKLSVMSYKYTGEEPRYGLQPVKPCVVVNESAPPSSAGRP